MRRGGAHIVGILAALMAGLTVAGAGQAAPRPVKLVTEEAMIASPQPGLQIYVRNKHPAGMTRFRPDRTLVFVHGATYPASTAFDLELGGLSWMDYIARRGFDVYLLDLPGYGRSTRPASMDAPPGEGQPVESTAQAVADYGAVADWVLRRRHLKALDVAGWSWGTTIAGGFAAEHPDQTNRLVLYAPVWLPEVIVIGTRIPRRPTGAYRLVTADAALKRWLNGVPEDKQGALIPKGWFDIWRKATWATDPQADSHDPPALRAPDGVIEDFQGAWGYGHPTYDPSRITAPTLMIQAEWDADTPPARSQKLFPLLTHAAWKQYVLIGEGTHTVLMERNRMLLFQAVQHFLEQDAPR